jgi:MoaA/NifB/PqqE/SkfB family radical SAM enzyme
MCESWRETEGKDFSTNEWKDIILQLKEEGITGVVFTGGEPTLRKDLLEIVEFASHLGFRMGLNTNGTLLSKDLMRDLLNLGISRVTVSVDGVGAMFEEVRGVRGSFRKVYDTLEMLSSLKKEREGFFVNIATVLMSKNLGGVFEVVSLAERLEMPIHFLPVDHTQYLYQLDGNKNTLAISREEYSKWIESFEKLVKIKSEKEWLLVHNYVALEYLSRFYIDSIRKDVPCVNALQMLIIDPHGQVFGCVAGKSLGNLKKERLRDIIHSEQYKRLSKKWLVKDCPGCSCGFDKNLLYSLKHVLREVAIRSGLIKPVIRNGMNS